MAARIKLTNLLDPARSTEIDSLIDTGTMMPVLPQNVVDQLGLRKMRDVNVGCANNSTEVKAVYGVVTIEIAGRAGEFDVLAEPEGAPALIGQIVLEQIDLLVDPVARKVIPNPRSPEMPLVEIFSAIPSIL